LFKLNSQELTSQEIYVET